MPWYEVVVRGRSREVYAIEASDEGEARDNWMSGKLIVAEVDDTEVDSVYEEED